MQIHSESQTLACRRKFTFLLSGYNFNLWLIFWLIFSSYLVNHFFLWIHFTFSVKFFSQICLVWQEVLPTCLVKQTKTQLEGRKNSYDKQKLYWTAFCTNFLDWAGRLIWEHKHQISMGSHLVLNHELDRRCKVYSKV